jgi:hypothetical protein
MLEFAIVLKHKRHIDMSAEMKKTDPEPFKSDESPSSVDGQSKPKLAFIANIWKGKTSNKAEPEPTQVKVGTLGSNSTPKMKYVVLATLKNRLKDPLQFAHVVDMYAQIIFAVSFVLFNIIYWAYYASVTE